MPHNTAKNKSNNKTNSKRNLNSIPRTVLYVFAEICKNGLPSPRVAAYKLKQWGIKAKELVEYAAALLGKAWAVEFANCL